jgi:ribosomal protein S18 acetylase RimI-like enzyme
MTDHATDRPPVALRPAGPDDADEIAQLFTDEGYPAGPSDIVARLERFASPHSRVVVAEHDGAILGFIAVHALPRFEHDDRILRVLALVVDAGARERGVGRTLMAEAERIGTELGAAFVEITAGHHRPEARHLYESLGYDATVTAYLRKKI